MIMEGRKREKVCFFSTVETSGCGGDGTTDQKVSSDSDNKGGHDSHFL